MADSGKHDPIESMESLSPDLEALDRRLGEALASHAPTVTPAFLEQVVKASTPGLSESPAPLPLVFPAHGGTSPMAQRTWVRAAAALLLMTGVAVAAWFGLQPMTGSPASTSPSVEIVMDDQLPEILSYGSREEAMLVALLDGDGVWLDQAALDHPTTIEAESVLRTQETNVEDLADEIDRILGATS